MDDWDSFLIGLDDVEESLKKSQVPQVSHAPKSAFEVADNSSPTQDEETETAPVLDEEESAKGSNDSDQNMDLIITQSDQVETDNSQSKHELPALPTNDTSNTNPNQDPRENSKEFTKFWSSHRIQTHILFKIVNLNKQVYHQFKHLGDYSLIEMMFNYVKKQAQPIHNDYTRKGKKFTVTSTILEHLLEDDWKRNTIPKDSLKKGNTKLYCRSLHFNNGQWFQFYGHGVPKWVHDGLTVGSLCDPNKALTSLKTFSDHQRCPQFQQQGYELPCNHQESTHNNQKLHEKPTKTYPVSYFIEIYWG